MKATQHRPRRRARALWAAALAIPLALSAVPAAADSPEAVTLRFAWWGGEGRHAYTQEMIDIYMEDNPHVTIEPEFIDWSDYWTRLATTVAGGDTPDVMQQDLRYVAEYANRGVIADLGPYLGDAIDDSTLDEALMVTGQIDGTQYAIPTGVNALAVVYDPIAFEEAGVEVPDDTSWTWDDFVEVGAAITEATDGEVFGAQDKGYNESNLEIFLRQRGEVLFTEEGELGFEAESMAEWWQITLDQLESGAIPQASITVEVENAGLDQSLLATNTGAMGFWWSNQLGALSTASGRDLGLLRFPGGSDGMYLKAAMLWSMSADTDHPEEAAAFISFLLSDPRAAELTLVDRGVPTDTAMRDVIAEHLDEPNRLAAEFVAIIGEEADAPPGVPPQGAGEVQVILQRLNEQVLFEQMSIEDAVETFMTEAAEAISN